MSPVIPQFIHDFFIYDSILINCVIGYKNGRALISEMMLTWLKVLIGMNMDRIVKE